MLGIYDRIRYNGFRGKFAFYLNFKITFGRSFGEHRNSGFTTDFEIEFEGDFINFGCTKMLKCTDRIGDVAANGVMNFKRSQKQGSDCQN